MPIKNILKIYQGNKLDLAIDRIHNYLNHTVKTETKLSPFEIISKYSILDPIQRDCSGFIQNNLHINNTTQQIKQHSTQFKLNDLVLVKSQTQNKLGLKYIGPYWIKEIDTSGFRLLVEGRSKLTWESVRNVKPYHGEGRMC